MAQVITKEPNVYGIPILLLITIAILPLAGCNTPFAETPREAYYHRYVEGPGTHYVRQATLVEEFGDEALILFHHSYASPTTGTIGVVRASTGLFGWRIEERLGFRTESDPDAAPQFTVTTLGDPQHYILFGYAPEAQDAEIQLLLENGESLTERAVAGLFLFRASIQDAPCVLQMGEVQIDLRVADPTPPPLVADQVIRDRIKNACAGEML